MLPAAVSEQTLVFVVKSHHTHFTSPSLSYSAASFQPISVTIILFMSQKSLFFPDWLLNVNAVSPLDGQRHQFNLQTILTSSQSCNA